MAKFKEFRCAKCGRVYGEEDVPANDGCGGRIDAILDVETLKKSITKAKLKKAALGLWKYFDFMPLRKRENIVSLGEGGTPLLKARRLAEYMKSPGLLLKNETMNPTGSFKDRPICVGLSRALEDGARTVASASSGNAATSLSAYAARAGMEAVVLVPEEAPRAKLVHLKTLGARVFRVRNVSEGVDSTTTLLKQACDELGWTPIPSFGPFNCFQFEGTKSLGYEIAEQTDWKPPDWVLFPTGSGGLMAGTMKGFTEFREIGLIDEIPRPVVVQPEGCSPIVREFRDNSEHASIRSWESTNTIAGGLADPYPWDWDAAIKYLREAHGEVVSVSDAEISRHLLLLARLEGIFAEPSGVAALAGLTTMIEQGVIDKSETVVVPITGAGFKDLDHAEKLTGTTPTISPDVGSLVDALDKWYHGSSAERS